MPKLAEKAFTETWLRNLKTGMSRRDHYDAGQRGLGIRVAPTGLKSWFVMRRVGGKMTRITIGRYPEIKLAEARQKAGSLLEHMTRGNIPARLIVPTFQEALELWFQRDQNGKRGIAEKRRAMAFDALPVFAQVPMDKIARNDIRKLLDNIVDRGAPIHANRVLAYLRRMFNWAVERDIITVSPVAGLKAPTQERSRDRTLSDAELAAVWKATAHLASPFDAFFRTVILTGQRLSEVAGAMWTEFDLNRLEWRIPAVRTKNGTAHVVHMSPTAIGILTTVPRHADTPFVFTTTGTTPISGFSKMKAKLDQASGVTNWTIHDLRRTLATIGTGDLGIDPVVMDKILNHRSGVVTGVAAVYQRHAYLEQRKAALNVWADHITKL